MAQSVHIKEKKRVEAEARNKRWKLRTETVAQSSGRSSDRCWAVGRDRESGSTEDEWGGSETAMKQMKSGKVVGPDDKPVEACKYLGERAVDSLTRV